MPDEERGLVRVLLVHSHTALWNTTSRLSDSTVWAKIHRSFNCSSFTCKIGIYYVLLCSFSLVWLLVTLWTIAHQAPLSMGSSRQEHWSRLLCPPGDLPNPGIKPASLAPPALAGGFFTTAPPGKPLTSMFAHKYDFGLDTEQCHCHWGGWPFFRKDPSHIWELPFCRECL